MIEIVKSKKPYQLSALICSTPRDLLVYELYHMLKLNIKVKIRKLCGEYFILKGDYNTDYCDRILPGEKLTCKKISCINARKHKINNNPILIMLNALIKNGPKKNSVYGLKNPR